jgi:hypothetical protein
VAKDLQGKSLAPTVPRRSLDLERMLTAIKSLLEPALITMDAAEIPKTAGFTPVIAEPATDRQCLVKALGSLLEAPEASVRLSEV